jgi:glutathione S-transferase
MQPAVGLAISLALIHYAVTLVQTGRARVRCGVAAPATTGHPEFERHFRVQQNSLEQLIVFVPAILVFGEFVNGGWVALLLGLLFVAGRTLYMRAYVRDPATRGPGFILGSAASAILLVGGLIGSAAALLRSS